MSTNYAPSRRATNSPVSRPSTACVAQSRFEEAKAITLALLERLERERAQWRAAPFAERFRVAQRIEATRVLLSEAGDYEKRSFALWEHERSVAAGKPVAGRTGAGRPRVGVQSTRTVSGASERLLRLPVGGGTTTGRRAL